jgi:hypothetical protein
MAPVPVGVLWPRQTCCSKNSQGGRREEGGGRREERGGRREEGGGRNQPAW